MYMYEVCNKCVCRSMNGPFSTHRSLLWSSNFERRGRKGGLHSSLLAALGSIAQQAIIKTKTAIQIGCNTKVPAPCATRPVTKGTTAPPLDPALLMKPTEMT